MRFENFVRIGEKLVSVDRVKRLLERVLELRAEGLSQQAVSYTHLTQVCAALQLAKEGISLNGELIIAATADEEQGGELGAGHLAVHCPEKIRADFAINEGAPFPLAINGKMIYFIQVGEKGTAWSRIKTRGVSCHGSIPTLGENAVVKMARAVSALDGYRPGIILIPELAALLTELARIRGLDMVPTPQNTDELLQKLNIDASFRCV